MATVEALAQARRDPTRSKTLRRRYARRLRGGFSDINTQIRRGVRDADIFLLEALAEPPPRFTFETDDEKVEAFVAWLRRQQNQEVLTVIRRDDNKFVRGAYGKGIRHADKQLRKQGIDVPEEDLAAVFNRPVHSDALQLLYTRNYEALQGITDDVAKEISRELTDGFAQGWGPRKMARSLTDRVDAVGKTRATTLARTEVINAHAESTLTRFEEQGVDQVTVQAEWLTAGDDRVCADCQALEGNVYSIDEARGLLPRHPRCRCAWAPKVSS